MELVVILTLEFIVCIITVIIMNERVLRKEAESERDNLKDVLKNSLLESDDTKRRITYIAYFGELMPYPDQDRKRVIKGDTFTSICKNKDCYDYYHLEKSIQSRLRGKI